MKKLMILCAIVLSTLLLIISVVGCQQKTQPPSSATGNIRMTATVNGLEEGEEATLTISHEGSTASEELFFKRDVISDGKKAITVGIAANLEDGYYQLLLEAPDKYFREPKGYFFMVSQSQIVNPTGRNVIFNLLPQPTGLVAEAYISLSAPKRTIPKYLEITTSVSGLEDETVLVTTHIYDMDTGKENIEWKRTGNGMGEIAIREPEEGHVYTITAEAEGYTVQPESYDSDNR